MSVRPVFAELSAANAVWLMVFGMAVLPLAANNRGPLIFEVHVGMKMLFDSELLKLTISIRVTDEEMAVAQTPKASQEREAAGDPVKWPPGQSVPTAKQLPDFPVDVATEARFR